MRLIILLSLFSLFMSTPVVYAASDDAELMASSWSRSSDLRVYFGTAAPLSEARVEGVSLPLQPEFSESLQFADSSGLHASVERVFVHMHYHRIGYIYGLGFAFDDHQGDSGDASLSALSLQVRGGVVFRKDLAHDRLLLFEMTPVLSVGLAQAKLSGSASAGTSDNGVYTSTGFLAQGVFQFKESVQFSAGIAWQQASADVEWDNTDESTIDADGMSLRFGFGFHW